MFGGNDKNRMHPQDLRNMFIFFILASLLYFTYDAFILKPQTEALKRQRAERAKILLQEQPGSAQAEKPPLPRAEALAGSPRIAIDNGRIFGSISLAGARIDDISFSDYFKTIEHKEHVVLLSPQETEFPRQVAHGWTAESENIALPGPSTLWHAEAGAKLSKDHRVTLVWDNGQGLRFENIYSIDDHYLISLTQKVTNNSGREVTLAPTAAIAQKGLSPEFAGNWIAHEGPVGFAGDRLHDISMGKLRKESLKEFSAMDGWAGMTDKYWLTALIPPQAQQVKYRYSSHAGAVQQEKAKDNRRYEVDFAAAPVTIRPGQSAEIATHVFAGPKKVILLKEYGEKTGAPQFDLAVDFGWFWFFTKPFFYLLHFLNEFTGHFGVALILMTIIVRMAAFPLNHYAQFSMVKMKKVVPQITEIRKNYGADKKKIMEETQALYEREGVNPVSGCLPLFIQIPIFFSLFKVLTTTIEMRQAPFFGWIHDLTAPDPTNVFTLFGAFPWDAPAFLHVGIWPLLIFIVFTIQTRLGPPPQDAVSRDMRVYMPILICYIYSHLAAGLVIYSTIGTTIGIIQQIIIMRRLGVPIHLFGETEVEKELDKLVAKGPGIHPLVDMAEKDVEKALFGEDGALEGGAARTVVSSPKPRKKKKK